MTNAIQIQRMNHEANLFAMELLMPFDLIKKDIDGIDFEDQNEINRLARKYKVSSSIMAIKIGMVIFA